MKKSNLFIVSAAAVLFLAACGTGGNTGNDSSAANPTTSQGGAASSNHKHSYGEWTTTKEPTCTEKGQKERTCECGEKQTQDIATVDHKYGEWKETKAPTCDADGEKERECSVCHTKETAAVPTTGHNWGPETTVEGSGEKVGYRTAKCSVDNSIEIAIAGKSGKLASGSSLKSDNAYPDSMKLGSNGHSISYTFDFNRTGTGKVYFYGAMDYWSDNSERGFYSGKNNNNETPNFTLTMNGTDVDISAMKDVPYSSMFKKGESAEHSGYTNNELIEVGTIALTAGTNTLTFTRNESYNVLVQDFIIILDDYGEEQDISEPEKEADTWLNFTSDEGLDYVDAYIYKPASANHYYDLDDVNLEAKWVYEEGDELRMDDICVLDGYTVDYVKFDGKTVEVTADVDFMGFPIYSASAPITSAGEHTLEIKTKVDAPAEPTYADLVAAVNDIVATAKTKEANITNGKVSYKSSWSTDFEDTTFKKGKDAAGKDFFSTANGAGTNTKYYYYDGETPTGYSISDYGSGPNYSALNSVTAADFSGLEFGSYMVKTDYTTKYYGAASSVEAMVGNGINNPNQDTVITVKDSGFEMSYMFKSGSYNWYKVSMTVTVDADGAITGFEYEWAAMYSSQVTEDLELGTFYVNDGIELTYNKTIYEGKTNDLGTLSLPIDPSSFFYTSYGLYNGETKINNGDTITVPLGDNAIAVDVKDIAPSTASDSFDKWTVTVTDADGNAVSGYNYFSSYNGRILLNAIQEEGTYNVTVTTKNTTISFVVVATAPLPQSISFKCADMNSYGYFDTTGPAKTSVFTGDTMGIYAAVTPSKAAQGTTITVTAPEGVTEDDYTFTPKSYDSWNGTINYYEFSSTKTGTFTFTATSTADPSVTSTHTVTVTAPLTLDQIFSGKYCYYNQHGDMLYLEMTFTPNTGTEAEGDGTVEIKSHMAGEKTGVYSYVADGAKAVKLTYVSGDDFIFDGSFQSDGDRDSMSITYKQTADDSWDNTYSLWTWEKYQSLIGA